MRLSARDFRMVVEAVPLVSLDLIIRDYRGNVLLGERLNRPAKGSWFVPGGRVRKNESLDEAFRRLSFDELGISLERADAGLVGVFEHFYHDTAFGENSGNSGTHYVVLAHEVRLQGANVFAPPLIQHLQFDWWCPQAALDSDAVHPNVKVYLRKR